MNSTVNSELRSFAPILFRRVPLGFVLVVPFVLQIVIAVGITGWLSLRNGQKTVNELAEQLRHQASAEVAHYLEDKLKMPYQINQLNLMAIQSGMLDLQNFDRTGQAFWQQMQLFKVGYVNFANPQGEFIGVERLDSGELLINERSRRYPSNKLYVYQTDQQGQRSRLIESKPYDPLIEAWYADAVKVGKPLWSAIYQWDDKPEILSISASHPIYSRNQQLVGVIGVDLILSDINRFLQTIKISPSAQVFILERNGLLVATSSKKPALKLVAGQITRLKAIDSQEPMIQSASKYLVQQFGDFQNIHQTQTIDLYYQGNREFIYVTPWKDELGLDWLIVVVVPESDFMVQVQANTRSTILLCLLALTTAILIGLMTSRWLTQLIRQLADASHAIAAGNLDQPVQVYGIDELEQLSQSFNQMAAQLQSSFAELENRVAQRTAEVVQAKDAADAANQAKSEFLAQVSHELRTPLNAIIGFAHMMERDPGLSNQHQAQAGIMYRNGKQLLGLINEILKVSSFSTAAYQVHYLEQTLALRTAIKPDITIPAVNSLLSYYLMQMPPDWIRQLHQAAVKGSDNVILQLIDEIPANYSPLADILKNWTKDFQFDHVINLLNIKYNE